MNIKQFTYEIFDGLTSASGFVADSLLSRNKQEANIQPEEILEQSPPVAPVFSAEELEIAKNLAREEGMQKGYEQAKKQFEETQHEKESKLDAVVAALATEIERIAKQVEDRSNLLDKDFAELAVSVAKQICANLPEETLIKQTESLIKDALDGLNDAQKIKIYLNPKNAAELNDKFTGAELKQDPEIALGDFKVEWQNGYLERDTKKLWFNIEQVLGKHFAVTNDKIINNQGE